MAVIYKVRNPELDYVEGQGILIDSFTSHRKHLNTFRLVVLNVIETIVKGSFKNMYGFIPSVIYICSDVNGNIYTIRINRFDRNSVIQQIVTTDELQDKYKSRHPEMFEIPSLSCGDIKYGG